MKKPSLMGRAQTAADFLRATTPGEEAPEEAPIEAAPAPPPPPAAAETPPEAPPRARRRAEADDETFISVTYRITPEQRDYIRRVAYERALKRARGGADLSEVVREALDEYIRRLEKKKG
jgi:hypothetical protein